MKSIAFIGLALLLPNLSHAEYAGSSFADVLDVVKDVGFTPKSEDEVREFNVYQNRNLPAYPVDASSVFGNDSKQLEKDAVRTVSESEDYYDRLPKLLHPNGVCVAGEWVITEKSNYTGLFQEGSKALILGRVSVTMGSTDFSKKRGFGFAGKIFPTLDSKKVVSTANFFTVDILLGQKKQLFLETALTNEPETGFDLSLIGLGLKIAGALKLADENPSFRPLYPLARVGTPAAESVSPHWMRIKPVATKVKNKEADFRNEVLRAVQENHNLVFEIDVSETTKAPGDDKKWKKLGEVRINQAIASYGCDRRLHFAHPKLTPLN